jgi:hypothetical protein
MFSSPAMVTLSALAFAMNTVITVALLSKPKATGNLAFPRKVTTKLHEANNVYDLSSIEQAIRWIQAVCGYPVKSTWLKAVKAGNFVGWPLLTKKNIGKYFPNTPETQQGHMALTRKNVHSTKRSSRVFKQPNVASLRGKKERDLYTTIYNVRKTTFSDQLCNHNVATNASW